MGESKKRGCSNYRPARGLFQLWTARARYRIIPHTVVTALGPGGARPLRAPSRGILMYCQGRAPNGDSIHGVPVFSPFSYNTPARPHVLILIHFPLFMSLRNRISRVVKKLLRRHRSERSACFLVPFEFPATAPVRSSLNNALRLCHSAV